MRGSKGVTATRLARPAGARWGAILVVLVGILSLGVAAAGPATAQGAAGTFTAGDLPSLVLTQEDAPDGAAMLETSGELNLSDFRPDDPSVFATLQTAGLEAAHQNCFDPWTGNHFVCSLALLFPDAGAASEGMGLLEANSDGTLPLGEEGLLSQESDHLQLKWRRSNVILGVTMLDQGASPSLDPQSDAMPLARQMDAKAVSKTQPAVEDTAAEDTGGGIFGSPIVLIGAILIFLLALGTALWLMRRSQGAPAAVGTSAPAAQTGSSSPSPGGAGQDKYCRNCGKPHAMHAKFCKECGHPFR